MIERIMKNEERFDQISDSIKKLDEAIKLFKNKEKDLILLKKYYGSKNWFKDKEAYENNQIPKIKAGVLSEDGVWNMLSDIDDLINNMEKLINKYKNNN